MFLRHETNFVNMILHLKCYEMKLPAWTLGEILVPDLERGTLRFMECGLLDDIFRSSSHLIRVYSSIRVYSRISMCLMQ